MDAEQIIATLELVPHPEGGHFREVYRHVPEGGGRGASTAIYYLLRTGERSHWHRVLDADEAWHHYAGAPLALEVSTDGKGIERQELGPDLAAGHRPFALVPAGAWQAAESLGPWSLVGCTVAPAFEFASFEMAPSGWRPGGTT